MAGTLAWYVPKDYMKPGAGQWAVRLGGLGAGFSWYLYDSSRLTYERVQEEPVQKTQLNLWQRIAVVAVLLLVLVVVLGGSIWLSVKTERAILRWLVRRGVARPNTLWGAVSAVVMALTVLGDDSYDPHLPGGILSK